MGKSPQVSASMRKTPKQLRSRVTIEAILDAAVQLLETGTISAISTNHIAERAGVSIGTLYQYFPNRNAVLVAVANRRRETAVSGIIDKISKVEAKSLEETNRQIVRILMRSFSNSHRERQLAILTMMLRLEGQDSVAPTGDVMTAVASKMADTLGVQRSESKIASFVLIKAVTGTVRAALVDAPHLINEQEFEDQLVRLVTGFWKEQIMESDASP